MVCFSTVSFLKLTLKFNIPQDIFPPKVSESYSSGVQILDSLVCH